MSLLETETTKPLFDLAAAMPAVAARHGRTPGSQLGDVVRLCLMGQRLSVEEYYNLRLFEGDRDRAAQRRFAGLRKSHELWAKMKCGEPWLSLIEDKVACELNHRSKGLPAPRTIAVTGKSYENGPSTLADREAFGAFLRDAAYPIFGKPMEAIWSLGVAHLVGSDANSVRLSDGRTMSHDAFWVQIEQDFEGKYIFQECLKPHESMAPFAKGGVATLRVVTLDAGNGPSVYRAVAKLTAGSQSADNFWREGNMLAPVDVSSGTMGAAITGYGVDAERLATHPATGVAIAGAAYPMWQEAFAVALESARSMPGAVLLGFDVAICEEGPVIVEINETPDFMMLQIASGEGVLDAPLLQAFDHAETVQTAA